MTTATNFKNVLLTEGTAPDTGKFKEKDAAAANTSKTTSYLYYTTDNWATCSWFNNIETLITSLAVSSNQTVFVPTKTVENKGKLYKSISGTTFIEVPGWKDINGEVHSLLNINGIIYAGTSTAAGQGKILKSKNDNSFELISDWDINNGEVLNLFNVDNILYVRTKVSKQISYLFRLI